MKVNLSKIASIASGVYAKSHKGFGDVYYLMARDFDESFNLKPGLGPGVLEKEKLTKHFLQKGDILFAAKGHHFFAAVYRGEVSPAVASSVFLVLRIKEEVVPDFIVWYLNHPETQKFLLNLATGSSLPSISKSKLAKLEIPIPPFEIQQKVVQFEELRKKEKKIKEKLMHLQNELLNHQLIKLVQ